MNRAERRRQSKQRRNGAAPGNASADLFEKATAQWRAGKIEAARQFCTRILRAEPDHVEALNLTGVLLVEQRDAEAAATYFARAIGIEPGNASFHYNHADALRRLRDVKAAEAGYRAVLNIDPRHSGAFAGMGHLREMDGQPDEAIRQFRTALDLNPANVDAICGIARALGQQGKTDEAVSYIRRAIQAEPALSQAQNEMIAALKAGQEKQIPVWHFSMLADRERNDAYQRAIEKLIAPSSRVLDIGTGSGLLALMAARAGAERVTACEMSKPVAEAARKVVAENGYEDVLDVVAKPSTALRIGEDMAHRATVLVSEILDAGLTGEGVVKFVRHAQRELLMSDARILPAAADVKAVLVALPRLRPVNPVAEISGFDLSAFGRFQTLHDYQSIDLKREPCERLTEAFDAISFDFSNLPPEASAERPLEKTIDVDIAADGQFHAIAFWFELQLDDEITVSSGPEGGVVHWGQAVQFFADDLSVQKGDTVRLKLYFDEVKIRWTVDRIVSR